MARENQGLQIALIVFVGITIVLGVTTYLGFQKYNDAATKVVALTTDNGKLSTENSTRNDEIAKLKKHIGVPATDAIESVDKTVAEGLKNGAGFTEGSLLPLLGKMKKTIDERSAALDDVKKDLQKLKDQYEVREDAKAPQLKKFDEERAKATKDKETEQAKYQNERSRLNDEGAKLQEGVQKIRTEAKGEKETIAAELSKAKTLNKKLADLVDEQARVIDHLTGREQKLDAVNGKVVATNQRDGTVWINLGRADSLVRQVTFAVYPAAMTNITLKDKKGSIEVTQILGDHLAEARVLDDRASNPIVSGDKINTVLWSPGQQRHFALAGFFDIDGDGRSDLATVMNLIKANGGVVDAYIADNGRDKNKVQGEITVNTNYLVLGQAPTEKGDPGQLTSFSKMRTDADKLRTPRMQLGDLLQGMGWRNLSPVVRYGHGINPNDFRAKPAEGEMRQSTGGHTSAFEKREPPASQSPGNTAPSRSYYRF
ncbi:MAG: hypothetical protein LLG00_12705 [Planctomycetaceae bacterium]|nr:hypothetical protein [Planctomycetaceae bacterium]